MIEDKQKFANLVAPILNKTPRSIFERINNDFLFVWLTRKKDKDAYDKIIALNLKGIDCIKEEKRVYANNTLAAQAIGFVGIDNQGLSGLEFLYDEFLTGIPGKVILESDPRGHRLITGALNMVDPTFDGLHVVTTLDSYIQFIAEKYLEETIIEQSALKGNVIVMNPKTGDILAMANYPRFNATKWTDSTVTARKNRCITDIYEPGSVFKIVTLSSAVDHHVVSSNSMVYVPETLKIQTRTIKEAHARKAGDSSWRKAEDILIESLNVGTSVLSGQIGKASFYQDIINFGIGEKTGVECPGESSGMIKPLSSCTDLDMAQMSFGQGIAVTPIQIAMIASVIANNGELVKPRFVQYFCDKKQLNIRTLPTTVRRRVIDISSAKTVKDMMVKVVDKGTATAAKIDGYSIAGKTGTAQIPDGSRGYLRDKYIASFVGFFPASDPKILILVIVDSPQKSIWGSTVAVPVFKQIAQDIIDYQNIPPDQFNSTGNITTIEFLRKEKQATLL